MKKNVLPGVALAFALATGLGFTACDTEADIDYTLSSDCMITAVTMGKVNRTIHMTRPDGSDSVYTYKVTGSLYPMTIDQLENRIYNRDSLPMGTDVMKVAFATLSSTGSLSIRSLSSGSDTAFVASDSTDFRLPRVVTAYSIDGTVKREYRMEVRVHQEEADSFTWKQVAEGDAALAALTKTRAVATAADGMISVFGLRDGHPVVAQTLATAPGAWSVTPLDTDLNTLSVTAFGGRLYAISREGALLTAPTASTGDWSTVDGAPKMRALAGTAADSLYAVTDEGFVASADGAQWVASAYDTPDFLPSEVTGAVCLPSRSDSKVHSLVVTALHDGKPMVWKRDFDLTGHESFAWVLYPDTDENPFYLPTIASSQLVAYDEAAWLIGTQADGKEASFYISRDFGRTWKKRSYTTGPSFKSAQGLCATVDAEQGLWIVEEGTGNVWRGRINRLGWERVD